jgi:hypothetical protein
MENSNNSTSNRNTAYYSIIEKLPEKRKLIFELIQENKICTAQELAEKYMLPINEITGRITELKNMCLVVEHGSKENRWTKHNNTAYQVVSKTDRIEIINKKFIEYRDSKDKLINDYNLNLSSLSKKLLKKEINKLQSKINYLEKLN